MTMILMMNLVLIPKINSYAATYPATTSFTYTIQDLKYRFYFDGSTSSPNNYTFSETALNTVINKAGSALNVSITNSGYKINELFSTVISSVFNLAHDFIIAEGLFIQDWFTTDAVNYQFKFYFTGSDPDYPGNDTYGPAYGWRFTGMVGETVDIVLDQNGNLYGSSPIGNVTLPDTSEDFSIWSIHQHDGDDIWIPSINTGTFNDLEAPYIVGKSLYFTIYNYANQPKRFKIDDFTRSVVSFYSLGSGSNVTVNEMIIFSLDNNQSNIYKDNSLITGNNINVHYSGPHYNEQGYLSVTGQDFQFSSLFGDRKVSLNYPADYSLSIPSSGTVNVNNPDYLGIYNKTFVSGVGDIWLDSVSISPVSDPVEPPIDFPIPFDDLPEDPDDFTDPDDYPDPVPGIDYPVPEPTPVPVPQLPSIVSGNDDLWPDMNGFFDAENELDSFLGPLRDFEFGSFSNVTSQFSAALVWVSTIMMALFDGSDFNILFSILAVFFIACALLGIYKWWNS